jgi:hypothetical protein
VRTWIRNTAFFPCKFADLLFAGWDTKEICWFAICRLIIANLRICDSGMSSRICRFAICGLTKKFACIPLPYSFSLSYLCSVAVTSPVHCYARCARLNLWTRNICIQFQLQDKRQGTNMQGPNVEGHLFDLVWHCCIN